MTTSSPHIVHIPLELMEFLNKINDNITDVRERIIRLETQEHSTQIRGLQETIIQERAERVKLEMRVNDIKTRIAPLLAGIIILAGGMVDWVFRTIPS